jgi:hypothetical protein
MIKELSSAEEEVYSYIRNTCVMMKLEVLCDLSIHISLCYVSSEEYSAVQEMRSSDKFTTGSTF